MEPSDTTSSPPPPLLNLSQKDKSPSSNSVASLPNQKEPLEIKHGEDKSLPVKETTLDISNNDTISAINSANACEAMKGRIIATHVLLNRLRTNEDKLHEEAERNEKIKKDADTLQEKVVTLRSELERCENMRIQAQSQQSLTQQLQARVDELQTELNKHVIDKKEKATLSQLQKKLKKLEEEQKEAVKFKKTTESYLQTLETDNKKLKDALAEAKKNIEEHEAAYMELAVNSDYKNEELTEDLAEAQKELIECRETLETNKKELEGMRQHTSTSESTAMVVMTGKYERIVTELHEAKVQIKQLEKEAVEKEKEREKEREKEKEKSQVMVYPSGEKVRQQEHTMSVALDFSSQLNELKQVFVVEIDTLKKQKAVLQELFTDKAIRVKELEGLLARSTRHSVVHSENYEVPTNELVHSLSDQTRGLISKEMVENERDFRQHISSPLFKRGDDSCSSTPLDTNEDVIEVNTEEQGRSTAPTTTTTVQQQQPTPFSAPTSIRPALAITTSLPSEKPKLRSSDLIPPEPLIPLPTKATTRRTGPRSKLEKFVNARLPPSMSSTLTSSASSSRKRATTTQEPTTPTEKSKKAKKEPLSILKDFHFQPEVSQADIANALPPGTSSYLQSTVRGGSEAATGIKSDTVLPSSPLLPLPSSTPSHFTSPLPSLFLPSTPPTTTPHSSALSSPVSSGTIQPLPETSIPDVQASKTPIFKAPFPVSRATGLLPPPPSDKSTEMNPKEIGDHVTLANASDVSEMKAVIELSIKDGPSQILCKMGQLSDFTNDMINKVLASLEIILQSLKSHGNPISKLEKNLPISCLYGDMGGVHLESPLCFDSREKNLACLLVGVIDFCPDHESAYQYITKWASGKALFLTKEGKVNLACRYTRIMSLLCKKMEDIQRLRVFCYDVVRYSPLPTNYIGLLMNVAIVWPEVLSIHSQDFSQIGEEMIPKVVQSATAAYCKLHNSIETARITYNILTQLCNWSPLDSVFDLEQCVHELTKVLDLEMLKQLMRSCPEAFYDLAYNLKQAYALLFWRLDDASITHSFTVNFLDPYVEDPKLGLYYAEIKWILQQQRRLTEL